MSGNLTSSAMRVILASVPAAFANLCLAVVVAGGFEALFDSKNWVFIEPEALGVIFLLTYLISALGLSLLVLIATWLPSPSNHAVSKVLFVVTGGLLGAGMFVWVPHPWFFGACGALTALVFVILPSTGKTR